MREWADMMALPYPTLPTWPCVLCDVDTACAQTPIQTRSTSTCMPEESGSGKCAGAMGVGVLNARYLFSALLEVT